MGTLRFAHPTPAIFRRKSNVLGLEVSSRHIENYMGMHAIPVGGYFVDWIMTPVSRGQQKEWAKNELHGEQGIWWLLALIFWSRIIYPIRSLITWIILVLLTLTL
jgi:cytochrome b561